MSAAPSADAAAHAREAARIGLTVVPVEMHTGWDLGTVFAFLVPGDEPTLVDAGHGNERAAREMDAALRAAGVEPSALARILVTHGHSDHVGGAGRLQDASGCEVVVHERDEHPPGDRTALFHALGFDEQRLEQYFGVGARRSRPARLRPALTLARGGEVFDAGGRRLRLEHHPGHSPGHCWVVDEATGAVFAGDYLLAAAPTTAGLEPEPDDPTKLQPMLQAYEDGLRALAALDCPVVFAAHGPPVTAHRDLIAARLARSERRTGQVLRTLQRMDEPTAFEVAWRMYGRKIARAAFDIFADVAGRLDVLVRDGLARAARDDSRVWRFTAAAR